MSEHKTDNELIAEFMGVKHKQDPFVKSKKLFWHYKEAYSMSESLNFDTSWDWLMPVVEKIAKLNYGVSITTWPKEWDAPIVGVQVMIHDNGDDGPVIERHSEPEQMITSIYKVVVEFIKWYNENGK